MVLARHNLSVEVGGVAVLEGQVPTHQREEDHTHAPQIRLQTTSLEG